jgi:hypothetical protein
MDQVRRYCGNVCLWALYTLIFTFSVPDVIAQSVPRPSINLSGTITATSAFQLVQASTNRLGCTIQNTGTHSEYVYFGSIGSATQGTAILLSPGQSVSCAVAGTITLSDAVNIAGTSGDSFFANFQ